MVRKNARCGRLSRRKGEGEGEGLFRQMTPVALGPLTLMVSPCPRGEATERRIAREWSRRGASDIDGLSREGEMSGSE